MSRALPQYLLCSTLYGLVLSTEAVLPSSVGFQWRDLQVLYGTATSLSDKNVSIHAKNM